jgi:hypothetical protein
MPWVAQFVAHGGSELTLELAGALRFFLGLHDELWSPLIFGEVARELFRIRAAAPSRRATQ